MDRFGKTKLITSPTAMRSKRGPFHQRSEGGFDRIYRNEPDALRETSTKKSKKRKGKSRLRRELVFRSYGTSRRLSSKSQRKRTAKWSTKK